MDKKGNPALKNFARANRKQMTPEERHLWHDFLKLYPVKTYRQKIIGMYIVDFYCPKAKLAIELDGSQHYSEEGQRNDAERDQYLAKQGIKVLRYSNYDFHRNFEGICMDIEEHIKERL
jgi:very-short-patch-repair endonuclease